MTLLQTLSDRVEDTTRPFLISANDTVSLADLATRDRKHLAEIAAGEVVALVGDFDAQSISDLFTIIDRKAIVMPLSPLTRPDHEYFLEVAGAKWLVEDGVAQALEPGTVSPLVFELQQRGNPGLVLFSTGTTGRPKAILHDMSLFLERYHTPRPAFRTLNFLLFDHIGGVNTLLHTVFNSGTVISVGTRSVADVVQTCRHFDVEVLPTTPTFLRMLLLAGAAREDLGRRLKVITYGTERMDQPTLDAITELLPDVDFRQTFGMSELGILRVKSEARNSLFMKVGGEGVKTRVVDGVLEVWSPTRMLGYLNAPSPFDDDGWYRTGDVVEQRGELIRVVGRTNDVINVGGLKFMASEVESVALQFSGVELVSVAAKANPITGQHVEILVQPHAATDFSLGTFKEYLVDRLPAHMVPRKIRVGQVVVGHRLKRM